VYIILIYTHSFTLSNGKIPDASLKF